MSGCQSRRPGFPDSVLSISQRIVVERLHMFSPSCRETLFNYKLNISAVKGCFLDALFFCFAVLQLYDPRMLHPNLSVRRTTESFISCCSTWLQSCSQSRMKLIFLSTSKLSNPVESMQTQSIVYEYHDWACCLWEILPLWPGWKKAADSWELLLQWCLALQKGE